MKVIESPIEGVTAIQGDIHEDERGHFRKVFDAALLTEDVSVSSAVQIASAHNAQRGTLRGLHFQEGSAGEPKTIWCVLGRVFDVVVDVRPDSPTYGQWESYELSAGNAITLVLPPGVAHGYQTLED
jgi:dTDP-4-dehydrorhamnose 3,5-epimerase